jgi:hypothetical protein
MKKTLQQERTMRLTKTRIPAVWAIAMTTLLVAAPGQTSMPLAGDPSVTDREVTGVHRGYTNDRLFLRVSDEEKEMTLVVRIPGDQEERWHTDFKTLSRITVTYHQGPGDELPVATAIRPAK